MVLTIVNQVQFFWHVNYLVWTRPNLLIVFMQLMYSIASHADIDDLGDVLSEIKPLASSWRGLSAVLGIKEHDLKAIEYNNPRDADMCLHMALVEWLKQNYDSWRHGKPSWKKLVEVIWSFDAALFQTIVEAHIQS